MSLSERGAKQEQEIFERVGEVGVFDARPRIG